MTNRTDVETTLPWVQAGQECVEAAVARLSDDELREPSALPGWTRGHVIGHLARNAEAIIRLVTWARTGVEHPMYASAERRDQDIEDSAGFPAAALRSELVSTAADLTVAFGTLDAETWAAPVRDRLGRELPATVLPWMRTGEVWLHAIDLDAGVGVDDLPADLVDALLDHGAVALTAKEGCPSVVVAPTDRERVWVLGDPGGTPPSVESSAGESVPAESSAWTEAPRVTAPAAALVGWITGRVPGSALPGTPPALPTWA